MKVIDNIAAWLARMPLYVQLQYKGNNSALVLETDKLPETISLCCDHCELETLWQANLYNNHNYRSGFQEQSYVCRNCKKSTVRYQYFWSKYDDGTSRFFKYGQYPELQERVPKELGKQLPREDLNLYWKALKCRTNSLDPVLSHT